MDRLSRRLKAKYREIRRIPPRIWISIFKAALAYMVLVILAMSGRVRSAFSYPIVLTSATVVVVAGYPGANIGQCIGGKTLLFDTVSVYSLNIALLFMLLFSRHVRSHRCGARFGSFCDSRKISTCSSSPGNSFCHYRIFIRFAQSKVDEVFWHCFTWNARFLCGYLYSECCNRSQAITIKTMLNYSFAGSYRAYRFLANHSLRHTWKII